MNSQPDDINAEPQDDEFCPECFGDDVIDLPDGNQRCRECGALIDY